MGQGVWLKALSESRPRGEISLKGHGISGSEVELLAWACVLVPGHGDPGGWLPPGSSPGRNLSSS